MLEVLVPIRKMILCMFSRLDPITYGGQRDLFFAVVDKTLGLPRETNTIKYVKLHNITNPLGSILSIPLHDDTQIKQHTIWLHVRSLAGEQNPYGNQIIMASFQRTVQEVGGENDNEDGHLHPPSISLHQSRIYSLFFAPIQVLAPLFRRWF